jgi:hypothetical protein
MRIDDRSISSNTRLHAHGAIQLPLSALDDFINSYGPAFSKVGPNNLVRMASSSDVHIAMTSSYTNQSSVNCTCYPILHQASSGTKKIKFNN